MSYPNAYSHWIEMELPDGLWSTLDLKAGCGSFDSARERIAAEKAKGPPFALRRFRIVDRDRRLIEAAPS